MKSTSFFLILGLLLALAACSTNAAKPEEEPTLQVTQETSKSDVSPTEEMLIREVLTLMLKELYPVERKEPEKSVFGGEMQTTIVYIYDQKHYDAARKIVQRFTRGGHDTTSLILANDTGRAIMLKIGSEWWPIEVPLGAGERRRFNGAGVQHLDEVEVRIAENKPEK